MCLPPVTQTHTGLHTLTQTHTGPHTEKGSREEAKIWQHHRTVDWGSEDGNCSPALFTSEGLPVTSVLTDMKTDFMLTRA